MKALSTALHLENREDALYYIAAVLNFISESLSCAAMPSEPAYSIEGLEGLSHICGALRILCDEHVGEAAT